MLCEHSSAVTEATKGGFKIFVRENVVVLLKSEVFYRTQLRIMYVALWVAVFVVPLIALSI